MGDWRFGALILYADAPDFFDEEIADLLKELAADLGFALKAAEDRKRLRTSEAQLQLGFERLPLGCMITKPDLTVVDWNAAAERIFGFTRQEVVGRDLFGLVIPESRRAFVTSFLQELWSSDRTLPGFYENLTKHGRTILCEWYSTPLKDEQENLLGVMAMAQDVTERQRIQDQLRRLSRAVEQSPTSIMITDGEGRIDYVNPKFTEIAGYSPDEVLGLNPRLLKSGLTPPEAYADLWKTIASGRVWHGEFLNRKKNGEFFWERATIAPIRDASGRITHYVALGEDVTAQKEAEAKLEEVQLQLVQAQRMEAVGRLAGGVAHDFNNVLTAILGYSEMLLQHHPPGDPEHDDVDEIRRAGERAASLTLQLLAFSRRQLLEPQVLDLNDTVTGVGRLLERVIGEDVTLITQLAPDLGPVLADRGQIEQVILNLAVNARDAMPGGGRLTIETRNVEVATPERGVDGPIPVGSFAQLRVADTGVGMTPDVQAQIFEPFFTTKEKGQGTGLGLSTAYGIIKQSGGFISVTSAPGTGSTFEIYLPRVDAPVQPLTEPQVIQTPPGTGETILLAEDDDAVRELAGQLLRMAGYEVLPAASGSAALALAQRHPGPIHLLLTDVVMPGLSGREIAEHLKALRPGIKALFMSGYTDDALTRRGVESLGVRFLRKPFTASTLLRQVHETLRE